MSKNLLDYIGRYNLHPHDLFNQKIRDEDIYIFLQKTTERIYCLQFRKGKYEGTVISNIGVRSILVADEWIIYGRLQEGEEINMTPQMDSQITVVNGVFIVMIFLAIKRVELKFKYGNDLTRNLTLHRPTRDQS